MNDRLRTRLVRLLGALPVAGLLVVVLGVATVAVYAEATKTWRWYLLMERAMAAGARLAVPLLALALLGGFGVVAAAPRFEE